MIFLSILGTPAAMAQTVPVIEYLDISSGRYFMTADPVEQRAFDVVYVTAPQYRTGLMFEALPADADVCGTVGGQQVCAVPVRRFNFNQFNWFYYTAIPAEWEQLNQPDSGFTDAGVVFKAFRPVSGSCPLGRTPVYRSYKNQNHRFPADLATHQRMVATGSQDEGIAFCAEAASMVPLFSAAFTAESRAGFRRPQDCIPGEAAGPCLVMRNLAFPTFFDGADEFGQYPAVYADRTGFDSRIVFAHNYLSLAERAAATFVQFGDPGQIGFHVGSVNRIFAGPPGGIDAAYAIPRYINPDNVDKRLLPFMPKYDSAVELAARFTLFVRATDHDGGSRIGGRLRLSMLDGSGRRMDFAAEVHGDGARVDEVVWDFGPQNFLSPGWVVVRTTIDSTTYGRAANNLPFLSTGGASFRSSNPWGFGGSFDYRIDQAALQRIVDAARTRHPDLTPDAKLYQVIGFAIENDVEGVGRLGGSVSNATLMLQRR